MKRRILILLMILALALFSCSGSKVLPAKDSTVTTQGSLEALSGNLTEPFTLVALPDTQMYTDLRNYTAYKEQRGWARYFYKQTNWIKKNKDRLNIVMVAHLGDITQTDSILEWQVASRAFKKIDKSVPYLLCLGNHDMGYPTDHRKAPKIGKWPNVRETKLNKYFPPSRFTKNPLYEKNFGSDKSLHFKDEGKSNNYYLFFEAGGMKFMIIALEFAPRNEMLIWANEVVSKHPERRCIVITHAYMNHFARYRHHPYGVTGNIGEAMWEKFVSLHENIFMVLCGHHVPGEGRNTSIGKNGNVVHEILSNYQNMSNGGNGWLRIMKFIPEEDKIEIKTYTPFREEYFTGPESQFALNYRMKGLPERP